MMKHQVHHFILEVFVGLSAATNAVNDATDATS